MSLVKARVAMGLAVAVLLAVESGGSAACRARPGAGAAAGHPSVEYFCPMHPQIVRNKPGECPVCGMKLEKRRRILYYRHPMNPAIHSDHPAKDDMGMAFIPVYEGEAQGRQSEVSGRAAVRLPPDRAALLGIRSEPVGSGISGGSFRTVGRVAIDERRREVVHAKYEGYVEKLFVDFTGQLVSKGQPLLAIYSPELVAAQQEYLVARRAQERLSGSSVPGVAQGGSELAEAARQRLRYWDVSPNEIASLDSGGTPLRTVTLRSPVSGVAIEKTAFEGMRVSPADRLYEIADLSRVWVLADVYEKDLPSVRLGTPARVSLPNQPGSDWRGSVSFVSPLVKPETRTVEVRVELDNPRGILKPDMFADLHLESAAAANLTIPETAVIFTGERTLVFLDHGEGRFEPREVTLGSRVSGGYEVGSGLASGDRVVVSANFLLDSESSLRAAIARAAAGH